MINIVKYIRPKNRTNICQFCNKDFKHSLIRKYCSLKCSSERKKIQIPVNCLSCNKIYTVTPTVYKYTKYCSKDCFDFEQGKRLAKCDYCNKEFHRTLARINRGKHNFCTRTCTNLFNRGKNHYEYKEIKHLTHDGYKLDRWSLEIKKRDAYICQKCYDTDPKVMQAHHIKPINENINLKYDLDNGMTLCIKCHANEHKNTPELYNFILSSYKRINYAQNNNISNTV